MWAEWVDIVEDILTIGALVGVIWSAVSFIRRVSRQRQEERDGAVSEWRKVAIHRIVSNSEQFMDISEILHGLMAESFDSPVEIKKGDLTEPVARRVLMEMVSDGVIGQRWPDHFGIVQLPRDITLGAVSDNIRGNLAARTAYEEIRKHPGRFTSNELYLEVGMSHSLTESDFELAILTLENTSAAKRDKDGKWLPIKSREA